METERDIRKYFASLESRFTIELNDRRHPFLQQKFGLQQLRNIAKWHDLPVTGNKDALVIRIHTFFRAIECAIVVQKYFRRRIVARYIFNKGPAVYRRELCNNTFDFFTMDPVEEIPPLQFFSWKEGDHVFGADIISFNALIANNDTHNPFTREPFRVATINRFRRTVRLGKVLRLPVKLKPDPEPPAVARKVAVTDRVHTLFHAIDDLGNYSHSGWFLSLSMEQVILFYRVLRTIWSNNLAGHLEVRRNICPPDGEPFHRGAAPDLSDLDKARTFAVETMENFVYRGINRDAKTLGAMYVLGALTIVSPGAAAALPWLFQSFAL